MVTQIRLGDVAVEVTFKDIKNIHLSVHPPAGRVSVAAPARMDLDTIRVFTITKLGWIKRRQRKLRSQARETPREYLCLESHFLWGKRFLLEVRETERQQSVEAKRSRLVLRVKRNAPVTKKEAILANWYREQLEAAAPELIARWAPVIGVEVQKFYVQKMKTKWGSCNSRAGSIRLNTDLAKKPKECFEYVVVHEMVHLVERTHNARFSAIMDSVMPTWRTRRALLNKLPVSHNEWKP